MTRVKFPDKAKARSLLSAACSRIELSEGLKVTKNSSPVIITTLCEGFLLLGEAILAAEGFTSSGKDFQSEASARLVKLGIKTSRPLLLLDELMKIRQRIKHGNYFPTEEETAFVISIKDALWQPLLAEARRLIEK